jgi:hypothetical protein
VSISREELSKALRFLEKGNWQAAHEIVQRDEQDPLACWAHGIVHIMEGDLPNARYWYGLARRAFPDEVSAPREITQLRASLPS